MAEPAKSPTPAKDTNTNEATLKAGLCEELRLNKRLVVFRHEDRFTHGIPDISATGQQRTLWIEAKYVDEWHANGQPVLKSRGIQEENMLKLSHYGLARYVIYTVKDGEKRTYVVPPRLLPEGPQSWKHFCVGHSHEFVAKFVHANLV